MKSLTHAKRYKLYLGGGGGGINKPEGELKCDFLLSVLGHVPELVTRPVGATDVPGVLSVTRVLGVPGVLLGVPGMLGVPGV